MAHVLFVCLHNAGRSQMSRSLFQRAAGGRHTADSAGTTPAEQLHPEVVEVMKEIGLDLSGVVPQLLTSELAQRADVVVTMGCGEQCPYIPGKRYVDWDLPDPKDQPIEQVRQTRELIAARVAGLVAELDARRPSTSGSDGPTAASAAFAQTLDDALKAQIEQALKEFKERFVSEHAPAAAATTA